MSQKINNNYLNSLNKLNDQISYQKPMTSYVEKRKSLFKMVSLRLEPEQNCKLGLNHKKLKKKNEDNSYRLTLLKRGKNLQIWDSERLKTEQTMGIGWKCYVLSLEVIMYVAS